MVRNNKNKKGNHKKGIIKGTSKFRGNRHSVHKPKNRKKTKRKFENESVQKEVFKKLKMEENLIPSSSDDSEEETENPLEQLLNTFGSNELNKKPSAIESEDSELSEEESRTSDVEERSDEDENEDIEGKGDNSSENNDESNDDSSSESDSSENVSENKEESQTEDLTLNDPFVNHLCYDLSEEFVDFLQNRYEKKIESLDWSVLGKLSISLPKFKQNKSKITSFTIDEDRKYAEPGKIPSKIHLKSTSLLDLGIKSQIVKNVKSANKTLTQDSSEVFTPLQSEVFSIINNYQDFYFTEESFDNKEQLRFVYSLHAINHILKTRIKVLHHNARLKNKTDDIVPDEFRDQGLVRPKVLIVVPFRDCVLKIVRMFIDILVPEEKGQVFNKLRFMDDFSGSELILPKKNPKPEDYERTFSGNCDDTFKIGIQVTKKSLKLYADFYSSDIIIASPLGLRLVVGAEGESERDYDFLSSIELLILDQTELFLMQNWDHLIHCLDHLHLQPRDSHGTDFSRIRNWTLNGCSKYYRQTLIFSSVPLPEINSVFNKKCLNYAGSARTMNPVRSATILKVCVQMPQVYRKFTAESFSNCINDRFELFVSKILPQYKDTLMKQCLVYVPNYFDYVKIRNYFKKEDVSFVQICEYSKDKKVARARDIFYHGDTHFLLYSERYHFFHRIRIKGIRHIVFYQPPTLPHFYSEMCNFMQEGNQNKRCGSLSNMSVTVLYSKYDAVQLAAIVGSDRAANMISSEKNFHMFTTSDT